MRPLETHKPSSMNIIDFFEFLFQTNRVKIYKRKLKEDYRPIGTLVRGHTYKPKTKTLKKGTKIFIREDIQNPKQVDVEFIIEDKNSNQPQSLWYKMTQRNYKKLRTITASFCIMLFAVVLVGCSAKRERTVVHYNAKPREAFNLRGEPCRQTGYEINAIRNQEIIYYKNCGVTLKGDLRAR